MTVTEQPTYGTCIVCGRAFDPESRDPAAEDWQIVHWLSPDDFCRRACWMRAAALASGGREVDAEDVRGMVNRATRAAGEVA